MNEHHIITKVVDPDLDGLACMMAYAELLQKKGLSASVGLFGPPMPEAVFVCERLDIKIPDNQLEVANSKIILVDINDLEDHAHLINPANVVEIIDHHYIHDAKVFPNAQWHIEDVGAAATLITERFLTEGQEISQNSARLLYLAIVSNTLNFQSVVTTERDLKAAELLLPLVNLPENFVHQMFKAKSDLEGPKLRQAIEVDLSIMTVSQTRLIAGQLEIVESERLIRDRQAELAQILKNLKEKIFAAHAYIAILDLEEGVTNFIAPEAKTQKILEPIIKSEFKNGIATIDHLLLRKQYLTQVRQALASTT